MKQMNARTFVLLVISILSWACKKDLTVFPANADVDGNLITDQATAAVVLNGVYYRFANVGPGTGRTSLRTRWIDVNEQFPSQLAGSIADPFSYDSVSSLTFSPALPTIDSVWVYCYNLVNAANGFIKNAAPVTNIPGVIKQQMLAEARFLRAFGNSELLFHFSQYNDPASKYGIILRDTFVLAANINQPRSGVAAAYTSILSDLDYAIEGLPVLNSAICYSNASDAKLLKARVLMNRGAAGDYAQVVTITNDLITNGPFSLENSLKDIFLTKGFASSEVMLAIQPYNNQGYRGLYAANLGITDSFVTLLDDDARSKWVYKAYSSYYPFNRVTKYYYSTDSTNQAPTALSDNSYAFRLSEAYLLEAEAIALSGGDLVKAKTLLKTVLLHAGAGIRELAAIDNTITPGALQLEIVKEYLRNFICENGLDWLALRRLPFATIQQLNPNVRTATRLILPIPTSELIYNNVVQNPGY